MKLLRSPFVVTLAACTLAALAASAGAAVLSGAVSSGGKGVVGASVHVLELDLLQITGADGKFAFPDLPPGHYRVAAGLIGYTSVTQTVDVGHSAATLDFELRETAIPMREIVVSASPLPRPADEQYQSVASKSLVPFETNSGSSYADKLADLPGVAVRGLGAAPNRPVLRGLSDNRVLVLENGLRNGDISTYDPAHATPLEAVGIDRVDVVRGPSSILYGPSTIGGLVNVITNVVPSVADHTISGRVVAEGNSVSDAYSGFFDTVYSTAHQAFSVSSGGLHTHDIRIPKGTYVDPETDTPFPLERMPQTFDRSSEEGLGYALQGDFGRVGIGGKHFEMNYGIAGVPPNPDWMDVPPTTSRISQKRNTGELHGWFDGGSTFARSWKLDGNYNDYNHREFPTAQDETGVSDPQANHFHKREGNAILQMEHRPWGALQGTLGVWTNIEDLTIDGDQPLGPNSRTTGLAGFAYEELVASPATRLQAGVRYDYNRIQTRPSPTSTDSVFLTSSASRTSNAVTASLGAVQKLATGLTASVSAARSFRAPTVQELFANGLDAPSGTYSVGTASLDAETGLGVDGTLRGEYTRFVFEVSPYVNFIHKYIYAFLRGDTILDFPVRQFAATDARLAGFEASVTVQAADRIALRASADYVNAEDTKQHVPLPFTPPLRGLVRATYQDARYTGMIETRMAAKQTRLGDGDTPTDGYAVANAHVGLRLVQQSVVHSITLSLDNAFDTKYRDHLSVIKDFLPQPGRGVRLDYEVQY